MDKVEDLKIVRAKWFVPDSEGEYYRLPARVMPKVRLDAQHNIVSKFKTLMSRRRRFVLQKLSNVWILEKVTLIGNRR